MKNIILKTISNKYIRKLWTIHVLYYKRQDPGRKSWRHSKFVIWEKFNNGTFISIQMCAQSIEELQRNVVLYYNQRLWQGGRWKCWQSLEKDEERQGNQHRVFLLPHLFKLTHSEHMLVIPIGKAQTEARGQKILVHTCTERLFEHIKRENRVLERANRRFLTHI